MKQAIRITLVLAGVGWMFWTAARYGWLPDLLEVSPGVDDVRIQRSEKNTTATDFGVVASAKMDINGTGFGGGDPIQARLSKARAQVVETLKQIDDITVERELCTVAQCESDSEAMLCHLMRSLDTQRQTQCREFIKKHRVQFTTVAHPSVSPFAISTLPLHIKTADGALLRVQALTEQDKGRSIIFHSAGVENLSFPALVATLVHELGHKLKIEEHDRGWVRDEDRFGAFANGRELLDTVGASIALFLKANGRPEQAPPPFAATVDPKLFCQAAKTNESAIWAGIHADLMKSSPPLETRSIASTVADGREKTKVLGFLGSEMVRRAALKNYFLRLLGREPQDNEERLMLHRLKSGVSWDAVVASIIGDDRYLLRKGKEKEAQFADFAFMDLTGEVISSDTRSKVNRVIQKGGRASAAQWLLRKSPEVQVSMVLGWFENYLNRRPTSAEMDRFRIRVSEGVSWETIQADILTSREYSALQRVRLQECKNLR